MQIKMIKFSKLFLAAILFFIPLVAHSDELGSSTAILIKLEGAINPGSAGYVVRGIRYANEINPDNWYKILLKKDVVWGHSDPNLDPCGYRSLMVLQLAEKFYRIKGLGKKLLANRPLRNVRPKSVELVNLLKTGNMDYAWEYMSVAIQHNLKYVKLDDHINLGNYKYDKLYSQARVRVSGKKPNTWIIRKGKSCTYGITILKNAPNPEAATAFMAFLLSPDGGLKILAQMGQPPFIPARVPDKRTADMLPLPVKKLVEVKN